jgi:hypothetical protein
MFTHPEIRMLVQHGYEVAYSAVCTKLEATNSAAQELWDPCPEEVKLDLEHYAKILEQGRNTRWGLWNWKDYVSWVLLLLGFLPFALGGRLVYQNVQQKAELQDQENTLKEVEKQDKIDPSGAKKADPSTATKLDWFTVLASYKESELEEARKRAKRIVEEVKRKEFHYPVEIYKTKISRNYAVTLGGRLESSSAAVDLAKTSRSNNWSADAFAQVDRQWIFVESYE